MVDAMWIAEFESLNHFTEYAIKVCCPGPSSEEEIIIANAGLYWLFLECASVADDDATVLDFETQATLCRENLETALAYLGFHVSSTLETAYALHMAVSSTYPEARHFVADRLGNLLSPDNENIRCMGLHCHSIPHLPGPRPAQGDVPLP